MAHAHARERRANIPGGPWRGKHAAWEGARWGICSPSLGHEGARRPAKTELAARAPPPELRYPALGSRDLLRGEFGPFSSICRDSPCRTKALPIPAVPACRSWGWSGGQAGTRDHPKGLPKSPPVLAGTPSGCPEAGVRVRASARYLGSQGTRVLAT